MTNAQLYLAIGVPIIVNAAMFGRLLAYMNARFDALRSEMNERFNGMSASVNERFAGINQRFDDMRDLWRSELHRVEEILDVRLKYLEERRG